MSGTKAGANKRWSDSRNEASASRIREQLRSNGYMSTPGGFGTTKTGKDGLTGQERAQMAALESKIKSKKESA